MLIARLHAAAAGPSRLGLSLRSLHVPALRAAKPPVAAPSRVLSLIPGSRRQSLAFTPTRPIASTLGLRMASTTTPKSVPLSQGKTATNPAWKSSKISQAQWPWLEVAKPAPKTEEVERVIYSRPDAMFPKITIAAIILMTLGLFIMIVMPSVPEARASGIDIKEEPTLGMPTGVFWTYIASGGTTVLVFLGLLSVAMGTRNITRLSLVRQKPKGAPWSQAREFLRLQHSGHDLVFGKRSLPRELPVGIVHPWLIMGKEQKNGVRPRNAWMRLHVDTPRNKVAPVLSWDSIDYRMDFRETPDLERSEDEIVLSVARIEDVFGEIKPSPWIRDGKKADMKALAVR